MKDRIYQGVPLSKKESELVQWLQKGEHTWADAFYMYKQRRTKPGHKKLYGGRKEMAWFNRTLIRLHAKGLCKSIPYVNGHFKWRNPGINASKASFVALSIQQTNHDLKGEAVRAATLNL